MGPAPTTSAVSPFWSELRLTACQATDRGSTSAVKTGLVLGKLILLLFLPRSAYLQFLMGSNAVAGSHAFYPRQYDQTGHQHSLQQIS